MIFRKGQFYGFVYLMLLATDVMALITGKQSIHVWVKPLLMPCLLAYFLLVIPGQVRQYWLPVALGLVSAWAGDVLLLFEKYNPLFFILGLSAFLITHIFYILFFKKLIRPHANWWQKNVAQWLTILAFGVLLVAGLWPYLGALKFPVLLYASVISVMVSLSLRIQPDIPKQIWVWLAIGAFLFLISDSILAINKFIQPGNFGGGSVMLTYGFAQYFIALGTVRFCQAISDVNQAPAE
jgi:uncharacterized membrane protein YhhN